MPDHEQLICDAADRIGCQCGGKLIFTSVCDLARYAVCRRCACMLEICGAVPRLRVRWMQPWRVAHILADMAPHQRIATRALMRYLRMQAGCHGMPLRRRFNGRPFLRQLEGPSDGPS